MVGSVQNRPSVWVLLGGILIFLVLIGGLVVFVLGFGREKDPTFIDNQALNDSFKQVGEEEYLNNQDVSRTFTEAGTRLEAGEYEVAAAMYKSLYGSTNFDPAFIRGQAAHALEQGGKLLDARDTYEEAQQYVNERTSTIISGDITAGLASVQAKIDEVNASNRSESEKRKILRGIE